MVRTVPESGGEAVRRISQFRLFLPVSGFSVSGRRETSGKPPKTRKLFLRFVDVQEMFPFVFEMTDSELIHSSANDVTCDRLGEFASPGCNDVTWDMIQNSAGPN